MYGTRQYTDCTYPSLGRKLSFDLAEIMLQKICSICSARSILCMVKDNTPTANTCAANTMVSIPILFSVDVLVFRPYVLGILRKLPYLFSTTVHRTLSMR